MRIFYEIVDFTAFARHQIALKWTSHTTMDNSELSLSLGENYEQPTLFTRI
jgi:hypothetical protein